MGHHTTLVAADVVEHDSSTTEDPLFAGETLSVLERVVIAPSAGVFRPHPPQTVTTEGEIVYRGQEIGVIESSGASTPVHSQFTGFFMGLMTLAGARVRLGEPVAWLRVLNA